MHVCPSPSMSTVSIYAWGISLLFALVQALSLSHILYLLFSFVFSSSHLSLLPISFPFTDAEKQRDRFFRWSTRLPVLLWGDACMHALRSYSSIFNDRLDSYGVGSAPSLVICRVVLSLCPLL
ncbi:uncharacterized protein F4812DRAFT_109405 [Daldinia caldariorum]|uniref:uncharacterized protein n=1 Tax=Daldinia caldariorum TaxID=326644 RepID=UPI0020086993|nr:uncharacterized protein F4812DRAFT_109405 [Daldinia caldariorum]KAI1465720.1 hypothetical protein F4812DRAFT_109405 [Daldinia caldariorum]